MISTPKLFFDSVSGITYGRAYPLLKLNEAVMIPSRPEYKAPAFSRELRIIEHFAKDGIPKSMGQLASELGLTFNQIYRIVHCLLAEGYLYQDKARLYSLTDKIELKYAVSPIQRFAVSPQCRSLMRYSVWQTNQSCHL